ncbi:helix-turn-helix domain-containing protein [Schleiferilactobacillus harbinensis]|uniref:helix-turn-helix domain-containing protein n=1 Tax=Schleiferilactobacillus harbinensis TaxID=304207 RepID=UPI0004888FD0|nr:helix-turn-helix transcriptional regulator [Schleiferilactobacillus harbinensis]QFR62608.1 helix-turn-helix domain-containing protein [Schleiferilactobacillus harbinensis]
MFGDTFRQLRTIYGYSAKELSQKLNISPSYLSEIENGRKRPSLTLLETFAKAFNLQLSTLVLLTEEQEQLANEGKSKLMIRQLILKTLSKYSGE